MWTLLQALITDYATLTPTEYKDELALNLRVYFPWQLDDYKETKDHRRKSVRICNENFPAHATIVKPQSFENQINNINKYFGNELGNLLRLFMNNMSKHFAGIISIRNIKRLQFTYALPSSIFLHKLVCFSFESSKDYKDFLEWVIGHVIANIEEGIDDLTIHVKRITMFTLKLMSLTLQDNETMKG